MYSSHKLCTIKIPDTLNSLNSICTDNCNLYLNSCDKNYILGIKIHDNTTFKIKLPIRVSCICYDSCEDLFLCKPNDSNDYLVQINATGDIIGNIPLNHMFKSCGKLTINCITFNENCNTIFISVNENNKIYIIDKLGRVVDILCNLYLCEIKDLKICDDYLFVYTSNEIIVYNNCFDKICSIKTSESKNNVLLVNKINKNKFLLFLVTCKNHILYLSKYTLSLKKICKPNANSIDNKCDCIDDDCHKFKIDLQSIYDLIESIALEETGLSHIINAEGEKIQKAVQICKNADCLLSVNKSVKETLEQIVQFEIILNSKLKTAHEMLELLLEYKNCEDDCNCNDNCEDDCDCNDNCEDDCDCNDNCDCNDDCDYNDDCDCEDYFDDTCEDDCNSKKNCE